jgi:hypothetical protein
MWKPCICWKRKKKCPKWSLSCPLSYFVLISITNWPLVIVKQSPWLSHCILITKLIHRQWKTKLLDLRFSQWRLWRILSFLTCWHFPYSLRYDHLIIAGRWNCLRRAHARCVSGMEIRFCILLLNCGSFIFIIASGFEKF